MQGWTLGPKIFSPGRKQVRNGAYHWKHFTVHISMHECSIEYWEGNKAKGRPKYRANYIRTKILKHNQ